MGVFAQDLLKILLEYCVLAYRRYQWDAERAGFFDRSAWLRKSELHPYQCPVYSIVIYLQKGGKVAVSPFVMVLPDGEEILRFHFRVRRFEMLKDILRETPAFQQILEEGREEGSELERQRILQSLRQKLLNLVQVRYDELFSFAQERVPLIEQVEVLEDLFFKIAIAATAEDARAALLVK